MPDPDLLAFCPAWNRYGAALRCSIPDSGFPGLYPWNLVGSYSLRHTAQSTPAYVSSRVVSRAHGRRLCGKTADPQDSTQPHSTPLPPLRLHTRVLQCQSYKSVSWLVPRAACERSWGRIRLLDRFPLLVRVVIEPLPLSAPCPGCLPGYELAVGGRACICICEPFVEVRKLFLLLP